MFALFLSLFSGGFTPLSVTDSLKEAGMYILETLSEGIIGGIGRIMVDITGHILILDTPMSNPQIMDIYFASGVLFFLGLGLAGVHFAGMMYVRPGNEEADPLRFFTKASQAVGIVLLAPFIFEITIWIVNNIIDVFMPNSFGVTGFQTLLSTRLNALLETGFLAFIVLYVGTAGLFTIFVFWMVLELRSLIVMTVFIMTPFLSMLWIMEIGPLKYGKMFAELLWKACAVVLLIGIMIAFIFQAGAAIAEPHDDGTPGEDPVPPGGPGDPYDHNYGEEESILELSPAEVLTRTLVYFGVFWLATTLVMSSIGMVFSTGLNGNTSSKMSKLVSRAASGSASGTAAAAVSGGGGDGGGPALSKESLDQGQSFSDMGSNIKDKYTSPVTNRVSSAAGSVSNVREGIGDKMQGIGRRMEQNAKGGAGGPTDADSDYIEDTDWQEVANPEAGSKGRADSSDPFSDETSQASNLSNTDKAKAKLGDALNKGGGMVKAASAQNMKRIPGKVNRGLSGERGGRDHYIGKTDPNSSELRSNNIVNRGYRAMRGGAHKAATAGSMMKNGAKVTGRAFVEDDPIKSTKIAMDGLRNSRIGRPNTPLEERDDVPKTYDGPATEQTGVPMSVDEVRNKGSGGVVSETANVKGGRVRSVDDGFELEDPETGETVPLDTDAEDLTDGDRVDVRDATLRDDLSTEYSEAGTTVQADSSNIDQLVPRDGVDVDDVDGPLSRDQLRPADTSDRAEISQAVHGGSGPSGYKSYDVTDSRYGNSSASSSSGGSGGGGSSGGRSGSVPGGAPDPEQTAVDLSPDEIDINSMENSGADGTQRINIEEPAVFRKSDQPEHEMPANMNQKGRLEFTDSGKEIPYVSWDGSESLEDGDAVGLENAFLYDYDTGSPHSHDMQGIDGKYVQLSANEDTQFNRANKR